MKKNEHGSGIVQILIALVVVGLVIAVGWLVYDKQKNNSNTKQPVSQANKQKQDAPKPTIPRTTLISSDNIQITYTKLPEGWKLTSDCQEDSAYPTKIILPPNKDSLRCRSEDWGFVAVSIAPDANAATKDCSKEEDRRKENQGNDYFVSYTCDEITVDSHKGTKETYVSNEKAPLTGGDTFTEYNFILENGKTIRISFTNPTSSNKPDYTNTLDEFVKSLEF